MYLETPEKTRIAIICGLLGIWAALYIVQRVRAVSAAMRIEKQLKAQSGAQLAGADADKKAEIEALRKKFDESLDALKKSKGGKMALFTLPWYVIIGPPGSGKTTALQESGLNFPASQGNAKVKGIGGTRNCDWWFTDEGILLDTAGRYTTVAEDQKEWFAFLDMIKQGRKQKPINGAIVAIGMDELLRAGAADLDRIAKDVRNRLDELSARLQAVFPVYVMFTKVDLLQGFVEFFEDFTKDERNQVWGMTFAYNVPDRQYADIFDEEARKLVAALAPRRTQLLASERPASKKQNVYLFPRQFELALPRMKEFIESLFHATAFQESAILRGIYFSSGTQKGTPIDQLMARMGAALGVEANAGADERIEKKSYFINHLFTRLIFPDKALARSSSAVLRKRRAVRTGLQFASVLALALASYSLISSFLENRQMVARAEAAAAQLAQADQTPADELAQLQALETMRRELAPLHGADNPLNLTMGMHQGNRVFHAGLKPYMRRLMPLYVEPTNRRVHAELRDRLANVRRIRSSEEYQQLLDLWRVYRMLGGELDPVPSLVSSVLKKNQRWTGRVGGSNAGQIEELAGEQLEFFADILPLARKDPAAYPWHVPIDGDLSKAIGAELQNAFWEQVAYDSILQRASEKLEPVTLASLLAGDENRDLLEIRQGEGEDPQKLLNGFTQEAWDTQIKPLIDERAKDLAAMFKELGMTRDADALVKALHERHRVRHGQAWRAFLTAVHPRARGFRSMTDARDSLRRLCGDVSPYRALFRRAWDKRALNMGPGDRLGEVTEQEQKALEDSLKALDEMRKAVDDFVTATSVGNRVRGHLQDPKKLESLRDAINAAYRKIGDLFPKDAAAGADVMNRVVDALFNSLREEAVRELESVWKGNVADPWATEVRGKYPFVDAGSPVDYASERNDVKLDSLARLMNPKTGAIWTSDTLFRAVQALKFNDRPMFVFKADYEDTIREARLIRDALFDTAQDEKIRVRFGLTLVQRGLLRSSTFQLGLNPQGQPNILRWNDNRDQTRDFVWEQLDSARAKPGARVTASWGESTPRTDEFDMLDQGWGLLKLLHRGSISGPLTNTEGKRFLCAWRFVAPDGIPYTLEAFINAAKTENPFAPGMFSRIRIAPGVTQ
jgi:type VI secretion system IcmF/VasK family protein